jgi:hypothetical protein
MDNLVQNSIPIIISFEKNLNIMPLIWLSPRSSLFFGIYMNVRNFLKFYIDMDKHDINLIFEINDEKIFIQWYTPIGAFYDNLKNYNYESTILEIKCICDNELKKKNLFSISYGDGKLMKQQRFKQGLATIHNSLKKFVEFGVKEIDDYTDYCTIIENNSVKYNNFLNLIKQLYDKSYQILRVPLVFHNKESSLFFSPKLICGETLYETILNSGFNIDIIKNNNLIINGISKKNWMDVPTEWAVINLCYSDLFIHIIY